MISTPAKALVEGNANGSRPAEEARLSRAAAASAGGRMYAVLLIPDGVGVRNFLLGDFLRQAGRKGALYALHTIPEELLANYSDGLEEKVQWQRLLAYRDEPLSFTVRNALSYAQMCWIDSQAMRFNRRLPVKGSWRTKAAVAVARLLGRAAATPRGIRRLDRLHCWRVDRLPEVDYYRRLFAEIRPRVLFCSHQRPLAVLPPVLAARSFGIPTATFIFSWDNLTSKGRIAAPFDHYLVWSEQMRRELLRYYPDVPPDSVHIVGTPQFDPYADDNLLWPREEFFRRIGADISRPLICYSGGDAETCPEDPEHVRALMKLIRAGRIRGNPQVVLRPAPVDGAARYEGARRDYPELIFMRPAWRHTRPPEWTAVIPLREDVQLLANLTRHADLNVNLASTMTLDFAIHDKPVVNIAFDVASSPLFGKPLWDYYYQFEHYRPVVELGAARFARSPEELADHVNAYLKDPSLDRDNRRRLVELEVSLPLGRSGQRIVQVLEAIAR